MRHHWEESWRLPWVCLTWDSVGTSLSKYMLNVVHQFPWDTCNVVAYPRPHCLMASLAFTSTNRCKQLWCNTQLLHYMQVQRLDLLLMDCATESVTVLFALGIIPSTVVNVFLGGTLFCPFWELEPPLSFAILWYCPCLTSSLEKSMLSEQYLNHAQLLQPLRWDLLHFHNPAWRKHSIACWSELSSTELYWDCSLHGR